MWQYLHQLPTLSSIWPQTGQNFRQIDTSSQFKWWFKSFQCHNGFIVSWWVNLQSQIYIHVTEPHLSLSLISYRTCMDELNGTVHRLQLLQVHVITVIRVIGHTSFTMTIFCCKNKCTKVCIYFLVNVTHPVCVYSTFHTLSITCFVMTYFHNQTLFV